MRDELKQTCFQQKSPRSAKELLDEIVDTYEEQLQAAGEDSPALLMKIFVNKLFKANEEIIAVRRMLDATRR